MEPNQEEMVLEHKVSEAFQEQAKDAAPIKLDVPTPYEDVPRETFESSLPDTSEKEGSPEGVSKSESNSTTDDYGNEIAPVKTYTQDELNERINAAIRDRLSRGTLAEQQAPQLQETYAEPIGDNWEAQLESFIEGTLTKREMKAKQEQIQRQEYETNAAFEIRFNQGASKYNDFEKVVVGKPLTPQMVTATRGMQDPAAFIYAAAKTQAPELERISRINDPMAQAVELGKLEERMRRTRASVSQAPRPIDAVKGDMSEKSPPKTWSIDDKLRQAEGEARKERMRGRTQ